MPTRKRGAIVANTIDVTPPSQSDEDVWVANLAAFILLCVIYTLAWEGALVGGRGARARPGPDCLPFQVLFQDLPSPEQRIFREMQEGFAEALARRASSGRWPTVEDLAQDVVPPFAPDAIDKTRLRWTRDSRDLVASYRGVPTAPGGAAPEFLILIQEPEPLGGEKLQPTAPVDEEHQLLPDGSLLHVTYWKRSPPVGAEGGLFAQPEARGWLQMRVTSPFPPLGAR